MPFSILAALAVGILSLVLGFIWYGPLLGKPWMEEVGLTEDDIKNGPGLGYLYAFIAASVIGAVTSYLIKTFGVVGVGNGAVLGLILGLGYVATTFATNYIFTQSSLRLYLIDAGYQVLLVTIAGIVAIVLV